MKIRKMRVIFVPDYKEGNPYQELLANSLSRFGVKVNFGGVFPIFSILRNAKKHWKPDILHIHWQHPFLLSSSKWKTILKSTSFVCELILLRLLGIKIIWTVHNIVSHERRFSSIELFFSKILAKLCDKLIVHCPSAKHKAMDVYGVTNSSITVIPHGNYNNLKDTISREQARKTLQLDSDDTVFLYFGQIRPYKGVQQLVAAFRKLKSAQARLLIVGRPTNEAIKAEIMRHCRSDNRIRTFLQFIPDEEVQIYMNASDVVVLPFRDILTSGSAILAMSFGKAVIIPNIGCVPEVLDSRGGFLYNPNEEEGLLKAMERALEADLATMGQHNFDSAKHLDWDGIAQKTVDVYRRCQ